MSRGVDVWKRWLQEGKTDLECARILYNAGKFSRALFHLQQANEKITKGLLLHAGWLFAERSEKDNFYRMYLGVPRKTTKEYSHKMVTSFFSDLEVALSCMEGLINYAMKKFPDFRESLERFREQVGQKETIKKIKSVHLDELDERRLEEELAGISQLYQSVVELAEKIYEATASFGVLKYPQLLKLKRSGIPVEVVHEVVNTLKNVKNDERRVKHFLLAYVCVCISAILDPLESVTRYPDKPSLVFERNNPYVKSFDEIHKLISQVFEQVHQD